MPRKIRPIRVEGNAAYVPLTKGYTAIIDAADVPLVDGWNWKAKEDRRSDGSLRAVYAVRNMSIGGRRDTVRLHRVILAAPHGAQCDHISGNGLDNRRANLRLATNAENQRNGRTRCDNTSGVKGVCRHRGKWKAYIKANGRRKNLGLFSDIADAAAAYAAASAKLHGEFGRIE